MDARTFKFLHWHVVTFVNFMLSDDPFERPPCITLIQNQIGRTIRGLRRARLARSFGWRGRIGLDGMDCLDGLHIHQRFVQVHCWWYKLGDLWKGSLTWLLRASTTWKVVQVHSTRYWLRLPLPSLDGSHFASGSSNILVPASHCFLLIFPHRTYPYDEENQSKKKKGVEIIKCSGRHLLRQVSSSWLRFSTVGTGPSPQAARRLRVTKSWKVLPGKVRTTSIRSK